MIMKSPNSVLVSVTIQEYLLPQEVNLYRTTMNLLKIKTPVSLATISYLTIILIVSLPSNSSVEEPPSAYDIIQDYDFPVGILPKGILSYELDKPTGKFSVSFNGTCGFSIEGSYQLSYKSTIKGRISKGKLSNLEGVQVKLLFLWVNIVEVKRSGEELDFSVGIASAGFDVDNFEESPQCGCGFNCGDRQVSKLRTNPLGISSY